MPVLTWHDAGTRYYENGTKKGVLYVQDTDGSYPSGVAWNGITAVTESPSGAEETAMYADDIKYLAPRSREEFGFTIEAYSSPEEFDECDGSVSVVAGLTFGQQARKTFGFCYRSNIGNEVSDEAGYKLHLIYGATANPTEKAYSTINENPEAMTLSWECTTIPVEVAGYKPVAHIEIDSRYANAACLAALEDALYGTASEDAYLPLPGEVKTLMTPAT